MRRTIGTILGLGLFAASLAVAAPGDPRAGVPGTVLAATDQFLEIKCLRGESNRPC
jgi:hypothetical protein